MRGSGIYQVDVDVNMECPHCGHTWDTYVTSDDWGRIEEDIKCTACHEDFTFTMEADEPDYEDERYEADEREWNETD